MAEYVVYVSIEHLRVATEKSLNTTFARSGFKRAVRRDAAATPFATLLFVGESHFSEIQLARHLEKKLKYDTMCDVDVIVFPLKMTRNRPTLQMASPTIH